MPIFREILEDNGMSFLNKKPSWVRGNQKTLLDHISTNLPTHVSNIDTKPMGTSDHLMVSEVAASPDLQQPHTVDYKILLIKLEH